MKKKALYSKKSDCKSCYKCIRACPTKSMSFYDGQAHIIQDECIYCGTCYYTCPQECKIIRDDTEDVKELLAKGNCYASVAPSFLVSCPGTSFPKLKEALIKLGFADAEETAIGATIVKKAYDDLVASHTKDIIISTCCNSVNLLIQKHYPHLAKYLAEFLSPMQAHAMDLKKRHPGCSVVFLGPCISKKEECEQAGSYADVAITYQELDSLLYHNNIKIEADDNPARVEESKARLFPTEGGVLATMAKNDPEYKYLSISGMSGILTALRDIESGNVHKMFIEMSACHGSCINGPVLRKKNILRGHTEIIESAGNKDFATNKYTMSDLHKDMPGEVKEKRIYTEAEIEGVLKEIGKYKKEDQLNCGSCGYQTCRDKAIAVLDGKANVSMCLPFLMEKATSFSNDVINNSPNAVIVTDENLNIQLTNKVTARIFKTDIRDLVGKPLSDYLDDVSMYIDAIEGKPTINKRVYWKKYNTYVEGSVVYNEDFHIISSTFRDRTYRELEQQQYADAARKTEEITRQVIERNMKAVQEIAQLLGESAADTKIALTNLSKVVNSKNSSGNK